MAFTAQELSNIANAVLDFYIKGPAIAQSIQDKPLMKMLKEKQKTFAGGKDFISIPVKGDYSSAIAGYTHNDTVTYGNPANLKRVVYPWKEIHEGIGVTLTELKKDGISVTDTTTGKTTSDHSEREKISLTGLLEDKLDDMMEGWARSFQSMLWLDGTQDPKVVPGILSILTDTPTTGTTGGLDRAANAWWRHRTLVGASKVTVSTTNQTLTLAMRKEMRQLRRFAKNPDIQPFCGSAFLEGLETEIQAKGNYTLTGFKGKQDVTMGVVTINGAGDFIYDPTLDDLGYSKRCYMVDLNAIKLMPMDGEDMKQHNPARPYDTYAMYRAMTWTGGLVAQQLNSSGVYEIA